MKTELKSGIIFFMLIACSFFGFSQESSCLTFDGANGYLTAPSTALNAIGTGDFTFEAWIRGLENEQPSHPPIFSNRTGESSGTVFFFHDNWNYSVSKMLSVRLEDVNYFIFNNGTLGGTMLDGACHHVAITREGSLLTFYFDGGVIGTTNIYAGNPSVIGANQMFIGRDQITQTNFNGNLSQIRIWNYARSQVDIQSFKDFSISGSSGGLSSYWEMDDGLGEVIIDKTGTANAQRGSTAGPDINDPSWGSDCCTEKVSPPTIEGAYCCEGENLVENGNFEFGNTGFTSNYANDAAVNPGQYNVANSAAPFGATVTDHSFCVDPIAYATNDSYLLVNGKTQKSGSRVIWSQQITGLERGKEYKFCANFKDMKQCTFNILPNITISAGSFTTSQIINTDDNDPCDWQKVEICFTATRSRINLKITLDETGNGDGNDLAIDDIALQQKLDPNYFITVQHHGNNNLITGSLNTISNADDTLLNEGCEYMEDYPYYWFVYEPIDPTAPLYSSVTPGTFGWSSNVAWSGPNVNGPWGLTTDFPDYPFASNKFYVIGMYIPSCCESCYTESWEYQITYNNGFAPSNGDDFSDEMKADIKRRFVKSRVSTLGVEVTEIERELLLHPNPAQDSFIISTNNDILKTIKVFSIAGQIVSEKHFDQGNKEETIDVSKLASGMYLINVVGESGKQYTAKLVKE